MTARPGQTCAAGHVSDELDYCSVCGAAMPTAAGAARGARATVAKDPLARGAKGSGPACPACGEPRADIDARFCEVCRFDFVKRAPGPAPSATTLATQKWELVLTIDASLDDEPDPSVPPPADPERIFPVEIAEMLVGRRDDKQNIRPAVPLNDPGASRRHAKFLLNADGTVSLHDLASMNGTKLNGVDVVSGSLRALKAGDEVTLGRWSRIKLRGKP
jgi:hypothetical protein